MRPYSVITRMFRILLGMACFVAILAGILSIFNSSAFERFRRLFAAGVMIFISLLLAVAILTLSFLGFGDWHFYMLMALFAGISCLYAHRMYGSRRVAGNR